MQTYINGIIDKHYSVGQVMILKEVLVSPSLVSETAIQIGLTLFAVLFNGNKIRTKSDYDATWGRFLENVVFSSFLI